MRVCNAAGHRPGHWHVRAAMYGVTAKGHVRFCASSARAICCASRCSTVGSPVHRARLSGIVRLPVAHCLHTAPLRPAAQRSSSLYTASSICCFCYNALDCGQTVMARSGHARHFSQLRVRALSWPCGVSQTARQRCAAAHAARCQSVGRLATNRSWQDHAGYGAVPTGSNGDQQASAVHADVMRQCYLYHLFCLAAAEH